MWPSEPTRIVTREQLQAGYVTFANGLVMRHSYKVIARRYENENPARDTYLIKEPQPEDHQEYEP
jgi:hypothetical protein